VAVKRSTATREEVKTEKPTALEWIEVSLRSEFIEPVLGSQPYNRELIERFLHEKARREGVADSRLAEELEASPVDPDSEEEARWTGFSQDPKTKQIFLWDYQMRGFLKAKAHTLSKHLGIKGAKGKIDEYWFVLPRRIYMLRDGQRITAPDGVIERPLLAMTMRGPRVTLARSDYLREGVTFTWQLKALPHPELGQNREHLLSRLLPILELGELHGVGQWRNGGWGRMRTEIVE
jgi:hypothetical protein